LNALGVGDRAGRRNKKAMVTSTADDAPSHLVERVTMTVAADSRNARSTATSSIFEIT
jgi:hypothetical protein